VAKASPEQFPREHRITGSREFRAIYNAGLKVDSASFVLFGRANNLDHHRLGLTVTRRIGGAVIRNRIKRLFREIFRKSSGEIPHHFDLIVNAKRKCNNVAFERLRNEFISAARKLCR
jgi:ribonuclease P protein component